MIYDLGPRARRVYDVLREELVNERYAPHAKLPSHLELSALYGVAPLTIRNVLAQLEAEGWVSREQGRGTFVRPRSSPSVLTVDDDALTRRIMRLCIEKVGYRALEASGPAEGLARLAEDGSIALVLSDVHMPDRLDGLTFINTVARRWPSLPIAAITAHPDDLDEMKGQPECPFLIVAKPVQPRQIEALVRFSLSRKTDTARRHGPGDRPRPTHEQSA